MPAPLPHTNLVSKLTDRFAPKPEPEPGTFVRNARGEMERVYPERDPKRFEEMRRKILWGQMQGGVSPAGLLTGKLK